MDLPVAAKVGIAVLAGAAAYFGITYLTGPSSPSPAPAPGPTAPPPKPGGGGGYTAPPPKTPDKAVANAAWGAGCRDGAIAGYAAGYSGAARSSAAPAAASSSSGNAAAYNAGYAQAYDGGFFSGNSAKGVFGLDPDSSAAATTKSKLQSACASKFETWFSTWVAAGAPAA